MKDLTPESIIEHADSVINGLNFLRWKRAHQCGALSTEDETVYRFNEAMETFIREYNATKQVNKPGFNPMDEWYVAELFKIVEKRNEEVEAL